MLDQQACFRVTDTVFSENGLEFRSQQIGIMFRGSHMLETPPDIEHTGYD